MILQCILYNNYVPSELRKIINDYYGEEGPTENLMYTFLAKLVYELKNNVFTEASLPYADHSPKAFVLWLNYNFRISVYRCNKEFSYNEPTVSPALFYKFYKEVNELGDDFVPPLFYKNKPPSLAPLRRNLRPSSSYELSTEYPDD